MLLRLRARCVLGLSALVAAGACEPAHHYPCVDNSQCIDKDRAGLCEAVGYCSFADSACESQRRFGALAPAEYADRCVAFDGRCIVGISAGASHTCAWKQDGTVWCWGDGDEGQLGDGQLGVDAFSRVPTKARTVTGEPLGDVTALAAGRRHTCARTSTEKLMCWGNNDHGQIGSGGTSTARPFAAPALAGDAELAAVSAGAVGANHSCALVRSQSSQDFYCFGQNDGQQVGSDTLRASVVTPTIVARPSSGAEPQAGDGGAVHTCALYGDRTVWCWGTNSEGQLGTASATPAVTSSPAQVVAPGGQLVTNAVALSAGDTHMCLATTIGEARCWGDGRSGQIGNASSDVSRSAARVFQAGQQPLAGVTAVGLGTQHSCAVAAAGRVYCWGLNVDGQAGFVGPNAIIATPVIYRDGTILEGFKSVVAGQAHSCALRGDGAIWCWGTNVRGRLGAGDTLLDPAPRRVALSCP